MSDREISAIHVDGGLYNLKDAVARAQQTTFKIFDAEPFKADLSVVKLSAEDYEQLVAGGDAVSNILYIVEGEDEDMYGQRVINVGWPTDLSDAATKLYVDSAVSAAEISIDTALSVQGAAADSKTVGDALRGGFTEWEFNGNVSPGATYTVDITEYEGPVYVASLSGSDGSGETTDVDSLDALTVLFSITGITATRYLITPTKTSQLSNDSGFLSAVPDAYAPKNDINISYYSAARKIVLSAGSNQTSVDCNDFIKDGMLSSAELCGTTLVLKFNTDSGSQPISVELSNFVDNYNSQIEEIRSAVSARALSSDLSNYYEKSETSSASEISAALSAKARIIIKTTNVSSRLPDLVINDVTREEYIALSAAGQTVSSELYLVRPDTA